MPDADRRNRDAADARRIRSPGGETRERRMAPTPLRRTASAAARARVARVGLGDGRAARRRCRDRSRDRPLERAVTPAAMVPGPSDAGAGRRREVPRRPDRPAGRLDPPRRDPRRRRVLRSVAPPVHAPRAVRGGRLPGHDPRRPAAGARGRDRPVEQRHDGLPVAAGGRARGDAVRRGDGAGPVRPATAARAGRRVRAHRARRAGAAAARRGLSDRRGVLAAASGGSPSGSRSRSSSRRTSSRCPMRAAARPRTWISAARGARRSSRPSATSSASP